VGDLGWIKMNSQVVVKGVINLQTKKRCLLQVKTKAVHAWTNQKQQLP
jgi:hypothetical protein